MSSFARSFVWNPSANRSPGPAVLLRFRGRAQRNMTLPHDGFDSAGCGLGRVVLPDADRVPARLLESTIGVPVPFGVCQDLFAPERRIVFRPRAVLRTAVPEASVHEYGDLGAWEYNVRLAAQAGDDATVQAEPQAKRVELRAKGPLDRGVSFCLPTHSGADGRGYGTVCRIGRYASVTSSIRRHAPGRMKLSGSGRSPPRIQPTSDAI